MLRDPFDLNKLGQIDTSMIIFQYYFFTNTQFKVSQLKHMNKKDVGQQKKKKNDKNQICDTRPIWTKLRHFI